MISTQREKEIIDHQERTSKDIGCVGQIMNHYHSSRDLHQKKLIDKIKNRSGEINEKDREKTNPQRKRY